MKLLKLLLTLTMVFGCAPAFARGRIQNADIKSLTDLKTAALTTTGNISSASACITSPGSTTGLAVGQYVYDSTVPANITLGTTIAGLPGTCSAGQIQMSANAAATATGNTLTFGGPISELINDSKIYVGTNGINDQLSNAISNGVLSPVLPAQVELLTNPGFEIGGVTNGWSTTGGTAVTVSSGSNLIFGTKTAQWTASGSGQKFQSAAMTINGLTGLTCEGSIYYKYAGSASDYSFKVVDGSATVLNSFALPVASAVTKVSFTYLCGASSTSTLQFQVVSNVASPSAIYFDNLHMGQVNAATTLVPMTIQRFTSGSGTYTKPAGVLYIRVKMAGGGGGGAGSSTNAAADGSNGGDGGDTTFGTSFLVANGGVGGKAGAGSAVGGGFSVGAGATTIFAANGGGGTNGQTDQRALASPSGGGGGVNMFGGAGGGSWLNTSGQTAVSANTGAGGGGAGGPDTGASSRSGGGGAAGGSLDVIITSPASTYSYSIGAAGASGTHGTSGSDGGTGAAGVVIVEEYYQ